MSETGKTSFPLHVDRNHLPEPEWNFPNAKIDMYATKSKPDFPPVRSPPKDSPNILLILLDDVGFGWPSSNGGLVRMPTAERLAKNGIFYNQFHTTALCSPTRAALLTGRNHHSVATGVIQEMATGYPGYCGIIPKSCATFAEDFSQAEDLADKEPARLRELQDLFMADAARYNAFPLDDRFAERMDVTLRPSYFAGRKTVTLYPGMTRLPEGSGPKLVGVPFTMTVPVEIPNEKAEGVIFALGGDAAGWSLFFWEGKARFHYNFFGIRRYDVMSPEPLSPGRHTLQVSFSPQSPKPGSPADVSLSVDGSEVASGHIDEQVPQRCGTETIDVGMDCVSPVCNDYEKKRLFPFTGKIESVIFEFGDHAPPTGMDRLKLATAMD